MTLEDFRELTADLMFGSKTIGATRATLCAQSNKTDAPGSITVASVDLPAPFRPTKPIRSP